MRVLYLRLEGQLLLSSPLPELDPDLLFDRDIETDPDFDDGLDFELVLDLDFDLDFDIDLDLDFDLDLDLDFDIDLDLWSPGVTRSGLWFCVMSPSDDSLLMLGGLFSGRMVPSSYTFRSGILREKR